MLVLIGKFIATAYYYSTYMMLTLFCFTHRRSDLIDLCEQSLQYILLLESFDQTAFSLLTAMRTLFEMMMISRDEDSVLSRRGRPCIGIEEEQLRFLIESNFRLDDVAAVFWMLKKYYSAAYARFWNQNYKF